MLKKKKKVYLHAHHTQLTWLFWCSHQNLQGSYGHPEETKMTKEH